MRKKFFTGDTHFRHTNIIKYCNRPFASTDEHDKGLINNWNSVVTPNDDVYHVGDFAFLKHPRAMVDDLTFNNLISRLNGTIHFLWGNHDKELFKFKNDIIKKWGKKFIFLGHYYELKHEGQFIVLSHYAHRVWNKSHHGSWHLYGHSHGTLPDDSHARSIDVGVDCHNYRPIEFNQVKEIMAKKHWTPLDHHGADKHEAGGLDISKGDYLKLERKRLFKQLQKEFHEI